MNPEISRSAVWRHTVGRVLQAVRLESRSLAADVLVDQGGDILNLIHRPTGIDLLWKVPYPVREPGVGPTPAGDSYQQWMHYYRGGWQTIFPNYGPAVIRHDALLDFHGEAARRPWIVAWESDSCAEIELFTHLASLPFTLRRRIALSPERPVLRVTETVTNISDRALECMWAHHPVFAAPLLSPESRIYTGARRIHPDPLYDVPGNDLALGGEFSWPRAGSRAGGPETDLSRIPSAGSGKSRVVFLSDFEEPWCAIVNPSIPLGVALRWNADLMKYLCLWQETGGERNFPHFGRSYTTALEPSVTLFGHGLVDAVEKTRTHLTVAGGESRTLHLQLTVFTDGRPVAGVGEYGEMEFAP